jgi:hypothetical protein
MTDGHTQRLESALAGRYKIQQKLGEGGMASVYLAEDVKHERNVALKILKPELAAVIGAERFLTEIKTTANLQHPHILDAAGQDPAGRTAGGGGSGPHRPGRGRRPGLRASQRHHPPGHQAGEHPAA